MIINQWINRIISCTILQKLLKEKNETLIICDQRFAICFIFGMKNADSPLTPIFQHSESEQAEIGVFGNEKKPKYSFEFERLPLVISKVFH